MAFDFSHDLMDVPIQNGQRSEASQQGQRRFRLDGEFTAGATVRGATRRVTLAGGDLLLAENLES